MKTCNPVLPTHANDLIVLITMTSDDDTGLFGSSDFGRGRWCWSRHQQGLNFLRQRCRIPKFKNRTPKWNYDRRTSANINTNDNEFVNVATSFYWSIPNKTRNSAVADKPHDAFVQMQWCGWPPVVKYLNTQVFKYYLNNMTGIWKRHLNTPWNLNSI